MILCGALERLRGRNGATLFIMKGGVPLELRLRNRARATKDLDTVFIGERNDLLEAIDEALAEPYANFELRRDDEPRDIGKALQIPVKLSYRGHAWATIPLEVSFGDGVVIRPEALPAMDLAVFGLEGPEVVACLPLNLQIAQKIHAMTEAPREEGRANDRYRDVADLLILRDLVADYGSLRRACEETFRARAQQSWPPTIVIPAHWPGPFARLAGELGLEEVDITRAAAVLQEFIAKIAAS